MQFSNVVLLCLSMASAVFAYGKCDVTRNACNVSTGNEPVWIPCHVVPMLLLFAVLSSCLPHGMTSCQ
ncbi:unnamed protein product [Zymoseptoria tritici ST99CH_3D7]|uniref:Hydrophobin n=2 Tax=Zymoseptoria tritici TaxID=1047171 RepID=A0A1X7RT64_ZYMT9|nr:unnamed protein product [Zymoseptoria tritici ST99CH_3D7]SMR52369.1 unnamed protein product [Zymoseptoria tritici ST99CH_1E4]